MASGVQRFLSVTAGTGLLILGIAGTQAKAATVDLSGDTSSPATPTWNRPIANGNNSPTSLSGVTVAYAIQAFSVDTSGDYSFLSVSNNPAFNNYTFLYQNSFDKTNPLANVIIGNDDFPTAGRSGFDNVPLTASTQYFFIATGNTSSDRGSFGGSISGPGTAVFPITPGATPVPFEFSPTLGLSILGAWFGLSQLKTRIGKHKSVQESQDQAL